MGGVHSDRGEVKVVQVQAEAKAEAEAVDRLVVVDMQVASQGKAIFGASVVVLTTIGAVTAQQG